MRSVAVLGLLTLGCADGDPTVGGRLICTTDGRRYEARVPPGQLTEIRDRADQAQLTDCHFEQAVAPIARWPEPRVERPVPRRPQPAMIVPPAIPINVPPTSLENNRIAGDKKIEPDAITQDEIRRAGKDKVIGSYKLCITVTGEVSTVSQLKGTGFSGYDGKIISELKTWRYLPYIYNGDAAPVCTAVTLIYSVP